MKGKIKKLVEEACPLHLFINGQLYISTDSIYSLLNGLRDSELPVDVSIKSTGICLYYYGMDYSMCLVNFEYDKE